MSETNPNSAVDELDVEKLAAYLSDNIEGFSGPIRATKFEGGQSNPTSRLLALRENLFYAVNLPGSY